MQQTFNVRIFKTKEYEHEEGHTGETIFDEQNLKVTEEQYSKIKIAVFKVLSQAVIEVTREDNTTKERPMRLGNNG